MLGLGRKQTEIAPGVDKGELRSSADSDERLVGAGDAALATQPDVSPLATSGVRAGTLALACVATAIVGAGLALGGQKLISSFTGVDGRVAALETRVENLKTSPANPAAAGMPGFSANSNMAGGYTIDPAYLLQRIEALQIRNEELSRRLDAAGTAAEVASIKTELAQLASEIPAAQSILTASKAATGAYSLAALQDIARSGGGFEPALAALAATLPNDANVLALAPFSAQGAPTKAQLFETWTAARASILEAAVSQDANPGFWGDVSRTLAPYVTVSRTDVPDQPQGVALKAGQKMDQGDLKGAVAELSRLSGPAADAGASWLRRARARLEIDTRLEAIRTNIAAQTASGN
jgi:hypothetical protein